MEALGFLIQLSYISTFVGKVRHVRYTKVLKYVSFKYDHIRCTLHGTLTYQIVLIDMKWWEIWPYKIPNYWALKVVLP